MKNAIWLVMLTALSGCDDPDKLWAERWTEHNETKRRLAAIALQECGKPGGELSFKYDVVRNFTIITGFEVTCFSARSEALDRPTVKAPQELTQ